MTPYPPEYVAARAALLDALDALHEHLGSLVLIGAQAVYLHSGPTQLRVPPTTTDADLAPDADLLADSPEIGRSLREAGFDVPHNPGHWVNSQGIAVDLTVPPTPVWAHEALGAWSCPGPARQEDCPNRPWFGTGLD